ncbi:MAG TPA: 3-oxoacyl-[acyl-carrier-protein] reductase [Caldisericia bacterium]|nr:3-oxoacyl-[acyl-carrier-protein] reductase [Caldisericia bacterium]HQL67376.1 3-oxoacyl-[acyl-carrier-protein] reductase [Caldisericia bacterium]HQN48184.1 3-oxoacyl-[acyl-carrier-protein] reductase [Caldisericia bacterium]HQO99167.1 3-oxoacyl-[acyl-carrier-protein] reductase [Caldisericia bacterium]
MERFRDKVVIITGGAGGIGRETALLISEEGGKVIIFDMNEIGLKEVEDTIKSRGRNFKGYKVDVSDFEIVQDAVNKVVEDFGKIDVLVNNAGITRDNFLTKMSVEDWNKVISINLTGTFNCTKAVIPYMYENGSGVIINVSSVVAIYGNIGQTNYIASKAGVIGLTKGWAKEFSKKGIRVNAVAPGFIKTPMTEKVPEKVIDFMVSRTPLGRMGETEEVAKAILFLSSDDASFITGVILNVDGGLVV